jgi:tetratricopeptide (TPR) repeat protein
MGTTVAQFARDPAKEIQLVDAAVKLFQARYPTDPGYFSTAYVLGHLKRTQGDMRGALDHFRAAGQVFEKTGSRDFTNLGASFAWAAHCEVQLGQVGAALRDYEKGIALLRQHAGETSMFTRTHLGLFAQTLHYAGRIQDAHEQYDAVLTPEYLAKPTAVEFDTAVYKAESLLAENRARDVLRTLDPFATTWPEFGKRFVPVGVRYLGLRARALARIGQLPAAKETLSHVGELPPFYGRAPRQFDAFISAAIDVALAGEDLEGARAVLAQRENSGPPQQFDLEFVQLALEVARLQLRSNDAAGAIAEIDAALKHLQTYAGEAGFAELRAALMSVRADASRIRR